MVSEIARVTGLKRSAIMRRAITFMLMENARRHHPSWIIEETSKPIPATKITRYPTAHELNASDPAAAETPPPDIPKPKRKPKPGHDEPPKRAAG